MQQSDFMQKYKTLSTVGLLILALFQQHPVTASDWPQWRGLNRDGISAETGLLKEWPKEGPPLVWKAGGLGAGFSGVSVVQQRVFTIGDREDANYVIALNRKDGSPIWSAKLGKAGAPGWGGFAGPRSTPTVDNDLVFSLGQ